MMWTGQPCSLPLVGVWSLARVNYGGGKTSWEATSSRVPDGFSPCGNLVFPNLSHHPIQSQVPRLALPHPQTRRRPQQKDGGILQQHKQEGGDMHRREEG